MQQTTKKRWFQRKYIINTSISMLLIVSLLVTALLPLVNVKAAETLNWSSNADFSMNESSKCQATQTSSLVISSTAYTDATCAAAAEDANIMLSKDKIRLRNVQSLSVGYDYSLVVKTDGTVWGWGGNGNGRLGDGTQTNRNVPVQVKGVDGTGFLTDVKAVAAGNATSLALKNDGTVWAWGYNGYYQIGDGSTVSTLTPVQVKGVGGVGFLNDVKAIDVGFDGSMALKTDGTVFSWGLGPNGDGSSSGRLTPVQVKQNSNVFLTNVASIDVGQFNSGALKTDGTVWIWGNNQYGQAADGTTSYYLYYATQAKNSAGTGALTDIKAISIEYYQVMALKNDGTAWSWGYNGNGQLGIGSYDTALLPRQVVGAGGEGFLTGLATISVGQNQSTATKLDGTAYAWGYNAYGQLGDGSSTQITSPVKVKGINGEGVLQNIAYTLSKGTFMAALTNDGSVLAWGSNNSSELGMRPSGVYANVPNYIITEVANPQLTNVVQLAAGQDSSIALKDDGTVWGWGSNGSGQLGRGVVTNTNPGVEQVKSAEGGYLQDVVSISASTYSSFAVKSDGSVWAWGWNYYYQLGTGDRTDALVATKVTASGMNDVKQVSASYDYTFALKNDGTVWCWGSYAYCGSRTGSGDGEAGQIKSSDGTGFLTGITAIASSDNHVVALKNDGTVWTWGSNGSGQLGNGTLTSSALPVQVLSSDGTGFLSGITSVSTSYMVSAALKNDGTVWSWGNNSNGDLGDGTTTQRSLPVQAKNSAGTGFLENVTYLRAGWNRTYAIIDNTTLVGWGNNGNGQLGDGSYNNKSLPVIIPIGGAAAKTVGQGYYQASAARTDGTVSIWGYSTQGNLGYNASGQYENNRPAPSTMYVDYNTNAGYATTGTASGYVADAGVGRKFQWNAINWTTTSLPANTEVAFSARTSNDGTNWSSWTVDSKQTVDGSTTGTANIDSLPLSRFLEVRTQLISLTQRTTPTLNDFSLSYIDDQTAPTANASDIEMRKASNVATIANNAWTNAATPIFNWSAGEDDNGGTGLLGYCLYLGQDATADLKQTKGLLGDSPVATDGSCAYIVSGTSLNTATSALSTALTTSDQPYHLLVKAIDKAGNLFDGPAERFDFRFDNTPPTTPSFISAPSQFIATKDATMTWPTTGPTGAADTNSGLAGLQYKIGTNGTWQGENHTGAQDISDVLENDGSYQTDATHDYPLLNEGNNIVYFRTIDNAGNVSTTNNTAAIKINTTSPTQPQDLIATPSSNNRNAFGFSWQVPSSFVGPANALTYCYTVNALPTSTNCTFTPAGQTNLAVDAYATQPGSNIMYVVAKDEAGNVNYDTYASVTFEANTPAPGIPLNTEIADISTKATQTWKLALSWSAPTDAGAGVSKYSVHRSTNANGTGYTQIATTAGLSYVDSNLSQQPYYYKIKACDTANNCGAFSDIFSRTPTGRFTTAPELVTSPSVQVSTKKASFSYVTDRVSDSRIQYGTKSGEYFPGEITVSEQTKNHKVEISNLDAGTTYFYKAKWTDEDGNTGTSTELSFTTLPAPSIKNVSITNQSLNSTTIQFTSIDASKVNIYYGKTEGLGGMKTVNTSRSESTYSVELTGLDDGSTYFYKFATFDSDDNEYDSRRADTFTTPQRPRISDLRFQPVVGEPTSTQKVTWKTNIPTSSTVSYNKTGATAKDIYDAKLTTEHEMLVKSLEDASEYSLIAQSRDANGNLATSDRQTFRTALDTRPPLVSDVQIESLVKGNGSEARGQIVVSWKTDEPATSQIAYAQGSTGTAYSSTTAEDNRLTTEHVVIVSDLSVSSVYHLQPISRDKSGNTTKGEDKSAIIGRATDSVLNIIISTLNKIFGL